MISNLDENRTKKNKIKIMARWFRLTKMLISGIKIQRITVHGKWLRFVRGILNKHYKMQAMLRTTKWNSMARRLLQVEYRSKALAIEQRWAKMIKKLAS